MSKELWSCLSVVCIGLAGCAVAPPAAKFQQLDAPVGCTGGVCFVDVWVSDCDQPNGIKTIPENLDVPLPRQPKNIRWRLQSEGFVFAYNGIVIKMPDGEFDQPEMVANGQMFKWRDKHTKAGEYHYEVNIVKTGENPHPCKPYDPLISNR
jgi:hypothetical protein